MGVGPDPVPVRTPEGRVPTGTPETEYHSVADPKGGVWVPTAVLGKTHRRTEKEFSHQSTFQNLDCGPTPIVSE